MIIWGMFLIQEIEEDIWFLHGLFGGAEGKIIYRLSVCRCLKIMMKGNLFLK